ncbi:hypothetical protein AKJ45_01095 [candidate division MSBL1 archaeon SCGC-AAA261F19]|uniref:Uncharacterized protein n=2 Tax=candidate division MSBL1 TaxID=215777 RepID=A0A133VB12_9EURY|nr:hypothetical protein AKJ43_01285 [candidate division MSBL1 archaeon SCGC-AAA261D19]KXB03632.1 hypothetical protein AKJ45_01095 [candidate division MSBL1 archaeon SCGC-AAA261F19]
MLYTAFEDIFGLLTREEDFGSDQIREFQEYLSKLPTERIDAVLNKVEPLVKNETLHRFFCGKSSIDFDELCQPGQLVILRLPKRR